MKSKQEDNPESPSATRPSSPPPDQKCAPCAQVRFAFGPHGQFFASTSEDKITSWRSTLGKSTGELVQSEFFADHVYAAAIIADGGVILAWADGVAGEKGRPRFMFVGERGGSSLYEHAYKTAFDKIGATYGTLDELKHINLTVGPNGSYFTNTSTGPLSRDLPTALESEIQRRKDEDPPAFPRQVALGRNASYVVLWTDSTWSYRLAGDFADLTALLQKYKKGDVDLAFVALNPHANDSWVVVDCDGLVSMNLRDIADHDVERIQKMAMEYMQRRARVTGLTFENRFSKQGRVVSEFKITPETKFDVDGPASGSVLFERWRRQFDRTPFVLGGSAAVVAGTYSRIQGVPTKQAVVTGLCIGTTCALIYEAGYRLGSRSIKS